MCWVCVYNARTGPMPRLVTQHVAVQDQKAHTTQHTHYTHIWTAVIHTLHTHTLSHSTPVMDRLMHSYLFLGRTRHRKNSDKMTRATRAFAYTGSIATGASPPHTIHTTRRYEWPTTTSSLHVSNLDKTGVLDNNFQLTSAVATVPGLLSCSSSRYCLLYTSPSPRDGLLSRMPSSA